MIHITNHVVRLTLDPLISLLLFFVKNPLKVNVVKTTVEHSNE